jgi:hypothetical protein
VVPPAADEVDGVAGVLGAAGELGVVELETELELPQAATASTAPTQVRVLRLRRRITEDLQRWWAARG